MAPPDTRRVLSPAERRRRNRREMLDAILDAARAVLREEGAAALNLNEVARRVGLRTPSVYAYFPGGKAAVYDALFRLGTRLYRERRERIDREHRPPWDWLRAALEAYMAFAQEHPELYELVFERHVPGFVPSGASMEESRELLASARRTFAEAVEAGAIRPTLPPDQALDLFIAMMHGLTSLHRANEPHLPAGSGRFGGLIAPAMALFEAAWGTERPGAATTDGAPPAERPAGRPRRKE